VATALAMFTLVHGIFFYKDYFGIAPYHASRW